MFGECRGPHQSLPSDLSISEESTPGPCVCLATYRNRKTFSAACALLPEDYQAGHFGGTTNAGSARRETSHSQPTISERPPRDGRSRRRLGARHPRIPGHHQRYRERPRLAKASPPSDANGGRRRRRNPPVRESVRRGGVRHALPGWPCPSSTPAVKNATASAGIAVAEIGAAAGIVARCPSVMSAFASRPPGRGSQE